MQIKKNKKYFSLYWEYLKRSDNYKDLCDCIRGKLKAKGKKPSDFSKPNSFPKVGLFYKKIDDTNLNGMEFRNEKEFERFGYKLFSLYSFFGDIYINNFEDWWNFKSKLWETNTKVWHTNAIKEYFPTKEIDDIRDTNCFIKIKLFPSIGVAFTSNAELSKTLRKQFDKFIKGKYQTVGLIQPTKIRDEIQTYLKVYDLRKQNIKWEEIIRKFDRGTDKADKDNVRIEFLRYNKKAKAIIKNAETGFFPGKYDKV